MHRPFRRRTYFSISDMTDARSRSHLPRLQGVLVQSKKDMTIHFSLDLDDTYFQYTTVHNFFPSFAYSDVPDAHLDGLDDVAIHALWPLVRRTPYSVRRFSFLP